jgi:hypothetical protein
MRRLAALCMSAEDRGALQYNFSYALQLNKRLVSLRGREELLQALATAEGQLNAVGVNGLAVPGPDPPDVTMSFLLVFAWKMCCVRTLIQPPECTPSNTRVYGHIHAYNHA